MAKSKKKKKAAVRSVEEEIRNFRNYSDRRVLERYVTDSFNQSATAVQLMKKDTVFSFNPDYLDFDPARLRRRKKALLTYMQEVRNRVVPLCQQIDGAFYIEEEWTDLNSFFFHAYDFLEMDECFALGAALWLLDRIRENGNMQEAMKILPNDSRTLEDLDYPEIYDPGFNSEVIMSTVWVIINRNADCTGIKTVENAVPRVFMDDYTAAGKQHQDVPSRRRFEQLLALAGLENLQAAAGQFEQKLWEMTELYFSCRSVWTEKEIQYSEKNVNFYERSMVRIKELSGLMTESAPKGRTAPVFPTKQVRSGMQPIQVSNNLFNRASVGHEDRLLAQMEALEDEAGQLDQEYASIKQENLERCLKFIDYINDSEESARREIDATYAEQISRFQIEDPYILCAGFLYLVDSGSDLPWLYFPGICVVQSTGGHLPWHKDFYDPECDTFWNGEPYSDIYHLNEWDSRPQSTKPPEPVDWYGLNYIGRYEGITESERTSLAQIVYQITGGVMPRNAGRYDDVVYILRRFGITGKKILAPLYQSIALLGEGQHRGKITRYVLPSDLEEAGLPAAVQPAPETPEVPESEPLDMLRQTIRELKEQNAELREANHDIAREAKTARRKLEEQTETWKAEREELTSLRELIYLQAQDTAERSEPDRQKIEFPYSTAHRIVVFGGHDSWLRAIRPMLPDVRFVAPGTLPNADLIRHADIVWIQANALSHADFHKIISVIRTHHVPIHYFSCASAAKCAEELAEVDLSGAKG